MMTMRQKSMPTGVNMSLFRTWTLIVTAPHVTISNLIIENSAGDGKKVGQAVALHLYNDDIKVINCILKAHQDTIFVGPLPDDLIIRYIGLLPLDEREHSSDFHHTFQDCHIIGDVDFIFGCGASTFSNCIIESNPLVEGKEYPILRLQST